MWNLYFLPTVLLIHFVSANQQPGFTTNKTSTVNTEGEHETSKSSTKCTPIMLYHPEKKPSMAILASEICKFAQIW